MSRTAAQRPPWAQSSAYLLDVGAGDVGSIQLQLRASLCNQRPVLTLDLRPHTKRYADCF